MPRSSFVSLSLPLCAAVLATLLGLGMMVPVLPSLRASLGITEVAAGLMLSGFGFARMAINAPSGYAIDRFGVLPVASFGILMVAAGGLAGGLTASYAGAVLAFMLQGAGAAAFSTSALTTMLIAAGPDHRGRVMSWFQTAALLSFAVGPMVGGLTAKPLGPHGPFWVTLVLAILSLGTLPVMARHALRTRAARSEPAPLLDAVRQPEAAPQAAPEPIRLIRRPLVIAALVGFSAYFSRVGFSWYVLPQSAQGVFGLDSATTGFIIGVGTACNLALTPLTGKAIDRIGPRRVLIGAGALSVAGFLLPVLWPGVSGLWVSTAVVMMGTGAMIPASSALALSGSHSSQTGRVMGLFRTVSDLGLALGPLLLPVLATQLSLTGEAATLITAVICTVGFCLSLAPLGNRRR